MFNLQGSEIIVILLIALVVLGPDRLPEAVRRFMQTYNELKKMGSGFQAEIKQAFDEPMREMRDTAKIVRDAADPTKLIAEAEAENRLRVDADAAVAAEPVAPEPVATEPVATEPVAVPDPAPPPPPPRRPNGTGTAAGDPTAAPTETAAP